MYTNCDEVFKLTIPAVRIAAAKSLSKRYSMSQSEIAKRLGIAQPAISKYLKGRYTAPIKRLESVVERRRLAEPVARLAAGRNGRRSVSEKIDEIASSELLVREALKLV